MFSNMYSLISKENDENCVVDNMYTVFWFNKQNEFEKQCITKSCIGPLSCSSRGESSIFYALNGPSHEMDWAFLDGKTRSYTVY
jgi:hypothetical protein